MTLTAIEQVAARAVDRDLWARYWRAKDSAASAGACRRCRTEIALAAVTEHGPEAQPHVPKLCGGGERIVGCGVSP